mmetsp:Transcript_52592/g.60162  ORF Transcript_52592/g.60162 Transcript_52592/m.60162 type:complete len:271 (-) Transcript_52592:1339-2151(-)
MLAKELKKSLKGNSLIKSSMRWVPSLSFMAVVPQGQQHVLERFGSFRRILDTGANFKLPIIDKVKYRCSTQEEFLKVENQPATTKDEHEVSFGVLMVIKIEDVEKGCYKVKEPLEHLVNEITTAFKKEIGNYDLRDLVSSKEAINRAVVPAVEGDISEDGFKCVDVALTRISLPSSIEELIAEVRERIEKHSIDQSEEGAETKKRQQEEGEIKRAERDALKATAELLKTHPHAKFLMDQQLEVDYLDSLETLIKNGKPLVIPVNMAVLEK